MELGSFLEMDLRSSRHLYSGDNVCMLNSARAGIWHSCRLYNVNIAYVPYYECYTVADFLLSKGVKVRYYHIDTEFNPVPFAQEDHSAVVLVNYFGLKSKDKMCAIAANYRNVIIDNAQAFFAAPLESALNVYSPRKFVGVPDGCYVVGQSASKYAEEYPVDYSSDTASFLFKRIEYGCEKSYPERMANETRIDQSDILRMSALSKAILGNASYSDIAERRRQNFRYAKEKFSTINEISSLFESVTDDEVPFVYPLLIKDSMLVEKLAQKKIFTGRWWKYILDLLPESTFEHYLSSYMLPVPIDQRYGKAEIDIIYDTIMTLTTIKTNNHE